MIDKITPRPDAAVQAMVEADGIEDMGFKRTSRGTYVAPFVNAEESQYLVIEDAFPNGRPALDKAGVIFTARETVDMVETMKVGTCLNPLHTCLAVCGCLLYDADNVIADPVRTGFSEMFFIQILHKASFNTGIPVPPMYHVQVVDII